MKRKLSDHSKTLFKLSRLSLRHQIPLLVSFLLCAVILIFGFISYFTVKNLEMKAGRYRLIDLATQVSNMIEESLNEVYEQIEEDIPGKSVITYLKTPSPADESSIMEALNQISREKSSVYAELRDDSFRPVLAAGKTPYYLPADRAFFPVMNAGKNGSRTGNFYHIKDTIYFPVIIPIKEEKNIIGYITCYRAVKITSKLMTQFSKVAGVGASLYVGNGDGSLWTDLVSPVSYTLPVEHPKNGMVFSSNLNSKEVRTGAISFIKETPWIVVLEFPGWAFTYASAQFFYWLIISGLLIIIGGFVVAWLLSRYITRPIKALTNATTSIAEGNYPASVAVRGGDEVRKLVQSFNAMSAKLKTAQDRMEQHILEAKEMNVQLRSLSAHLENIREEERRKIAREMHDELGQLLTGFKMDIYLLKRKLKDNENPEVGERIHTLENTAGEAIQFVRKLSSELRLGPLEELGLEAALEWYCGEFTRRYQVPVNFKSSGDKVKVPSAYKSGIFRIFQESLTNIARHANATQVEVTLHINENILVLTIKDNGLGFNPEKEKKKTLGLLGMEERAIMLGGSLKITSAPKQGTLVEIIVGLKESDNNLKI